MEEGDSNDRRYQEPENQLEPLRTWAKALGLEITKEYVDRGTGKDANRPALREMLQEAMLRRFTIILVWKLDRFSREKMTVLLGRVTELRNRGIAIKSLTETWCDTSQDNPVSELMLAIFGWVAAEESRRISERTKAGIQRLRNIGQWKGGRPKKRGV
jgi:DNA invertase Pin-like site-specific DNA recombinase